MKKWKCTVCGYIHIGDEPPEKCPVCGADRSKFIELVEEAPREEAPAPEEKAAETSVPKPDSTGDRETAPPETAAPAGPARTAFQKYYKTVTEWMVKYHAHPISVHIPNGVLPVAVLFLVLSVMFQAAGLEKASFYNMIVVVLVMPKVLFSGYNDWKHRLGGKMTRVIRTKMICGGIVQGLGLLLVIWRWVNPAVALSASSSRMTYLFLHIVLLGAAIVAGFMGGKLVRFPGD